MRLDEHLAIRVTIRKNPSSGVFTAETRGVDTNGGASVNHEMSADEVYRCAVGYRLHALAERLISGSDELPDRVIIEIRRDRSGA